MHLLAVIFVPEAPVASLGVYGAVVMFLISSHFLAYVCPKNRK